MGFNPQMFFGRRNGQEAGSGGNSSGTGNIPDMGGIENMLNNILRNF
jgi:hypothetical protein